VTGAELVAVVLVVLADFRRCPRELEQLADELDLRELRRAVHKDSGSPRLTQHNHHYGAVLEDARSVGTLGRAGDLDVELELRTDSASLYAPFQRVRA